MKTTTEKLVQIAKELIDTIVSVDRENVCVKMQRKQGWQVQLNILINNEVMEVYFFECQSWEYNSWVLNMAKQLIIEDK